MRPDWFDWLMGAATISVIALVVICVIAGIHDCRAQQRCEDAGGHVEQYDCHTTYITTSCGSDCWTTIPSTSCEWRCVGAPAESPR